MDIPSLSFSNNVQTQIAVAMEFRDEKRRLQWKKEKESDVLLYRGNVGDGEKNCFIREDRKRNDLAIVQSRMQ